MNILTNIKLLLALMILSFNGLSLAHADEQIPFINNSNVDDLLPNAVYMPEKLHKSANKSYKIRGVRYQPQRTLTEYSEEGKASWYGQQFHGRLTSSGERFNMHEMTAAHRTLPIPSYVKVTNLANKKTVVVRINDRGPFHGDRILDLSYAAAKKLAYSDRGVATVKIEQIVPPKTVTAAASADYITVKTFTDVSQAQQYLNQISLKSQAEDLKLYTKMVAQEGNYLIQVANKELFERYKSRLLDF